jgi:hypothetical protein
VTNKKFEDIISSKQISGNFHAAFVFSIFFSGKKHFNSSGCCTLLHILVGIPSYQQLSFTDQYLFGGPRTFQGFSHHNQRNI